MSDAQLRYLATHLRDEVLHKIFSSKITLFLCGKSKEAGKSIRSQLAREFTNGINSYRYEIIYPEDLFEELAFGRRRYDLLSLENILADSVDAIVLVPESAGALVELGAFANNDRLRGRIICVQDEKHKKRRSFVQYGPLRLLRREGRDRVIYVNGSSVTEDQMKRLRGAVSMVARVSPKRADVTNIIQMQHFILPALYLLEPITKQALGRLLRYAADPPSNEAETAGIAALSVLSKKRLVELSNDGYRLTRQGLAYFKRLARHGKSRTYLDLDAMDTLRVQILTLTCRQKAFSATL